MLLMQCICCIVQHNRCNISLTASRRSALGLLLNYKKYWYRDCAF